MNFLARVELLILAFVAIVVCDGAMAAPPFTSTAPTTTLMTTPIPGNVCQDYDNALSAGPTLNGVAHPNSCQFSSAQITLNGLPFDQFWQEVSSGAVAPPYHVTYSTGRLVCATATQLNIAVSMRIQTARLDWPGAASVGMACFKEWTRHSPASLVNSGATSVLANSLVQKLVHALSSGAPSSFQSCSVGLFPTGSRQKNAFVGLAAKVQQYMATLVNKAQTSWSPPGASLQECKLHCGLCASGWAGTITLTKAFTANGQNYYNETDTLLVGGPATNGNRFPVEWTAAGSGTYHNPINNDTLTWSMSADMPGQCMPLASMAACIQALAQTNVAFSEPSGPVGAPNAYTLTETPSGGQPVTSPHAATETQINTLGIATASSTDTQVIGGTTEMSCSEKPPLNPGTFSCTQVWGWELFKQ